MPIKRILDKTQIWLARNNCRRSGGRRRSGTSLLKRKNIPRFLYQLQNRKGCNTAPLFYAVYPLFHAQLPQNQDANFVV